MGGRPKKKTRINQKTSKRLQLDAIRLAETTQLDAADIWNSFKDRGETVSYSTVKVWLQKNKLARKRGKRARKTLSKTDGMEQIL